MFTIVVAGGSSERFGSNKLNQIIDEETVLERTVRIALESSDGVIVVTDPKLISIHKYLQLSTVVLLEAILLEMVWVKFP